MSEGYDPIEVLAEQVKYLKGIAEAYQQNERKKEFFANVARIEQQRRQVDPEYDNKLQHAVTRTASQYISMGHDEQTAQQMAINAAIRTYAVCMDNGRDPTEVVAKLVETDGYKPSEPKPTKPNAVERVVKGTASEDDAELDAALKAGREGDVETLENLVKGWDKVDEGARRFMNGEKVDATEHNKLAHQVLERTQNLTDEDADKLYKAMKKENERETTAASDEHGWVDSLTPEDTQKAMEMMRNGGNLEALNPENKDG